MNWKRIVMPHFLPWPLWIYWCIFLKFQATKLWIRIQSELRFMVAYHCQLSYSNTKSLLFRWLQSICMTRKITERWYNPITVAPINLTYHALCTSSSRQHTNYNWIWIAVIVYDKLSAIGSPWSMLHQMEWCYSDVNIFFHFQCFAWPMTKIACLINNTC